MRRTVQLVHVLPSGAHHIDWMIESRPGLHAPLLTYQINSPLDAPPTTNDAIATRIDDHRRRYLWYQGDISDNRGHVTQHACGFVATLRNNAAGQPQHLSLVWTRRIEHGALIPCWIPQTIEFTPLSDGITQSDTDRWRISVV